MQFSEQFKKYAFLHLITWYNPCTWDSVQSLVSFFTIQKFVCHLFLRYPRHRKLISINKIYTGRRNREFNLRHDWNSLLSHRPDLLFQRFSRDLYPDADVFPRYLSVFEKELGLQVKYNTDIGSIRALLFEGSGHKGYILTDRHGVDYKCRYCGSCSLWIIMYHDLVWSC